MWFTRKQSKITTSDFSRSLLPVCFSHDSLGHRLRQLRRAVGLREQHHQRNCSQRYSYNARDMLFAKKERTEDTVLRSSYKWNVCLHTQWTPTKKASWKLIILNDLWHYIIRYSRGYHMMRLACLSLTFEYVLAAGLVCHSSHKNPCVKK